MLLLNWNGLDDTLECLESVLRNHYPSYQIILCDNASSDGSVEAVAAWARGERAAPEAPPAMRHLSSPPVAKPIPLVRYDRATAERGGAASDVDAKIILIETGANLGFAGGNNVGLRYALARDDFAYVWLLNNDTAMEPDALEKLVARASADPRIGMCGSTMPYYDRPDLLWALGGATYNPWLAEPHNVACREPRRPVESLAELAELERSLDYIVGASMLLSRDFLREIGPMCEDYFLYYEELDWARRSRGRFEMGVAVDSVVYHKVGSSTKTLTMKSRGQQTADFYAHFNKLRVTWRFYPQATAVAMPKVLVEYAGMRAIDFVRGLRETLGPPPQLAEQEARVKPAPQDEATHPLVSICIPTRNGARWLRESIDSARAQTHPNIEIVVSDDASTDDTEAIVRSYRDERIRFEKNKRALGLPGNWNRCIERAKGEHIQLLFQGDFLAPTCVERMVAIAEEDANVGLVFCRRNIVLEHPEDPGAQDWLRQYGEVHGPLLPLERINDGPTLIRRCLAKGVHVNRIGEPTAVLVRRSCYERFGLFDPRLKQIVDWEMWLRIMSRASIGFVDEALVSFRVDPSSASAVDTRADRDRFDKLWLWRSLVRYGLPRLLPRLS